MDILIKCLVEFVVLNQDVCSWKHLAMPVE